MSNALDLPRPVLDGARVLAYALIDESVGYTGMCAVYVGGKLLGRVPRLALCEDLRSQELMLFHCDAQWNVLGVSGNYASLEAAKHQVEGSYPGSALRWVALETSAAAAWAYLRESSAELRCSFCGRIPIEVESLIEGPDGRICDVCVREFTTLLGLRDVEA